MISRILILFLLLVQCRKKNEQSLNPNPSISAEKTISIRPEKESYKAYEVSILKVVNASVGKGKTSIKVNGQPIEADLIDSSLVFVTPSLLPSTYAVDVTLNGMSYQTKITIEQSTSITNPEDYISEAIAKNKEVLDGLRTKLDSSLFKDSLLLNVQQIDDWVKNLEKNYQSLSADEKLKCAYALGNNKWWLDELHEAVKSLTSLPNLRLEDTNEDYEANVKVHISSYLLVKAIVIRHIPKVIALASGGYILGGPIGSGVGLGLGIGLFASDIMALNYSQEQLVSAIFQPFQNLISQRLEATTINFISNEPYSLMVKQDYRSLSIRDKNSPIPLIQKLLTSFEEIKKAWGSFARFLPKMLKGTLVIEDVNTFKTSTRYVHSNYLNILNISNRSVRLANVDKSDGQLKVTFTNASVLDQDFTFNVLYESEFGKSSYKGSGKIKILRCQELEFSFASICADKGILQDEGLLRYNFAVSACGGKKPYTYTLDGNSSKEEPIWARVLPGNRIFGVIDSVGSVKTFNIHLEEDPLFLNGEDYCP